MHNHAKDLRERYPSLFPLNGCKISRTNTSFRVQLKARIPAAASGNEPALKPLLSGRAPGTQVFGGRPSSTTNKRY